MFLIYWFLQEFFLSYSFSRDFNHSISTTRHLVAKKYNVVIFSSAVVLTWEYTKGLVAPSEKHFSPLCFLCSLLPEKIVTQGEWIGASQLSVTTAAMSVKFLAQRHWTCHDNYWNSALFVWRSKNIGGSPFPLTWLDAKKRMFNRKPPII